MSATTHHIVVSDNDDSDMNNMCCMLDNSLNHILFFRLDSFSKQMHFNAYIVLKLLKYLFCFWSWRLFFTIWDLIKTVIVIEYFVKRDQYCNFFRCRSGSATFGYDIVFKIKKVFLNWLKLLFLGMLNVLNIPYLFCSVAEGDRDHESLDGSYSTIF